MSLLRSRLRPDNDRKCIHLKTLFKNIWKWSPIVSVRTTISLWTGCLVKDGVKKKREEERGKDGVPPPVAGARSGGGEAVLDWVKLSPVFDEEWWTVEVHVHLNTLHKLLHLQCMLIVTILSYVCSHRVYCTICLSVCIRTWTGPILHPFLYISSRL